MIIELEYDKYEDCYFTDRVDLCRAGLLEFLDLGTRLPRKLFVEINTHPYHDDYEFVVLPATLQYGFRSGHVLGVCVDYQYVQGSVLYDSVKHYCQVYGVSRLYVTFYR